MPLEFKTYKNNRTKSGNARPHLIHAGLEVRQYLSARIHVQSTMQAGFKQRLFNVSEYRAFQ